MNGRTARGRLLASSIMGGVGLVAVMAAAPAYGQTDADAAVAEIVVTGSRIRRAETTTPAPVVAIDSQTMADRGFVQAGEALNEMTSVVPDLAQAPGDGAAAGSGRQFPNIFGLGEGRTLTLVNGRRFVTSTSGGDRVVDTNVIPMGLIKRIDVVQAGGAAVYGSDAIAGVVNYVLRDDFDGLELDARYGISSRGDYPQYGLRATAGRNFLDGRGNVAANLEWSKTRPLYDYDRPRTNLGRITASNPANTGPNDGIPSITEIYDARFWPFSPNGVLFSPAAAPVPTFIGLGGVPLQFDAAGTALIPYNTGTRFGVPFAAGGDGLTYRELAALRTGIERWTANAIGKFDLTDRIRLSGELTYAKVEARDPYGAQASNTVLNNAASGAGAISISRTNPYLSDAVRARLGPGGPPLFLSKWWSDLLPTREANYTTETVRALAAVEGDFDFSDRNFYWSLSYSHAEADGANRSFGVVTDNFNRAVNAVRNAAGAIVCGVNADATTANDDPACAPLNPFGVGNVSQEARLYVTEQTGQDFLNTQDDLLATLGGDLFELPAGTVKFSVAYEHREEKAKFVPLPPAQQGILGSKVPTAATSGGYNTDEFSGEVLVPLAGGDFVFPLVRNLEFNGAYRYVDNSIAGKEDVWSAGLRWEVVEGLTLRGSKSRNFRAPTLDQLFAPSRTALGSISRDPCDADRINAGPNPAVRLANCQALFAANPGYGPLATFQDPSENFSNALITSGGNPDLRNEISKTTTFGFVFQPVFAPGLTIVVDRVEVDLRDGLSAFQPVDFLATCFDSAEMPADVCSRFTRDAQGYVVAAESTYFNAGLVKFRGEVYNINYAFPVGRFFDDRDLGQLELNLEATHTDRLETSVTGFDRSRTEGTVANPDWVARFDARWNRGPLRLTYTMNYLPEVDFLEGSTIENATVPRVKENYRHSVSGSYDFGDYVLRAGVNNLTDEAPSYPTRTHGDIIGRSYFVGLTARF